MRLSGGIATVEADEVGPDSDRAGGRRVVRDSIQVLHPPLLLLALGPIVVPTSTLRVAEFSEDLANF